ncbi:MAG: hypothetical protein ACKPBT_14795, partial [Microcystis aeruginosa]
RRYWVHFPLENGCIGEGSGLLKLDWQLIIMMKNGFGIIDHNYSRRAEKIYLADTKYHLRKSPSVFPS